MLHASVCWCNIKKEVKLVNYKAHFLSSEVFFKIRDRSGGRRSVDLNSLKVNAEGIHTLGSRDVKGISLRFKDKDDDESRKTTRHKVH